MLSTVDELTRSGSRRFFEQQFPREVERAERQARPLALLIADIDYFKRVNDTHGHQVGDEVLREFARRLTGGLRHREDWVARVGGEEFAIVLPDALESEAMYIADRLRARVSDTAFGTSSGNLDITASFGVWAGLPPRDAPALSAAIVKCADVALYTSKREGRNRVTRSSIDGGPTATTRDGSGVDSISGSRE